jgi:hypothetical protein
MDTTIRFVTNIVKPWEQLNVLLAQRYVLQPDISDATRMAGSLSIEIKHQAELSGLTTASITADSLEYKVMSDVADAWKHGKLRDSTRDNRLIVGSRFEGNAEGKFRFIRNVITIEHASLGKLDFITTSAGAISYWIGKLNLPIRWSPIIAEGPSEFHDEVFLYLNTKYQVSWSAMNIMFFQRSADGELNPYDPPEWKFALYEKQ